MIMPLTVPIAVVDRVVWRAELMTLTNVTSTETIRRWLQQGRLPRPDVALSQRTTGWRLSTLRGAGINVG
jgi:predicted DNA-binding transcriptional regulator AlpA